MAQIKRYVRLTNLIPKILDMVDDERIAFTIAVELSSEIRRTAYGRSRSDTGIGWSDCQRCKNGRNAITGNKNKSITVNDVEAEIVRFIFDRYIEGYGAYTITNRLSQERCGIS